MDRVIVLASGGLDSTTVAYDLNARGIRILPLFINYGQHCVETERTRAKAIYANLPNAEAPHEIDISGTFALSKSRLVKEADLWTEAVKKEDLYIPYRTLLFFSISAAFAQTVGITKVYSGFINSNYAEELDCSASFMNDLEMFAENIGSVRFIMPFRYNTKQEVVSRAVELGVPIGQTFSCQTFSDIPCGACPNCVERLQAIRGVRDSVQPKHASDA